MRLFIAEKPSLGRAIAQYLPIKGVPQGGNRRGDLYVRVTVKLPEKLSKEAKKLVEDLKKEGI